MNYEYKCNNSITKIHLLFRLRRRDEMKESIND